MYWRLLPRRCDSAHAPGARGHAPTLGPWRLRPAPRARTGSARHGARNHSRATVHGAAPGAGGVHSRARASPRARGLRLQAGGRGPGLPAPRRMGPRPGGPASRPGPGRRAGRRPVRASGLRLRPARGARSGGVTAHGAVPGRARGRGRGPTPQLGRRARGGHPGPTHSCARAPGAVSGGRCRRRVGCVAGCPEGAVFFLAAPGHGHLGHAAPGEAEEYAQRRRRSGCVETVFGGRKTSLNNPALWPSG